MINSLLDAAIVRLPVSCFFAFGLDMRFPGIYYRQALSLILPAIVGPLYFKSKHWERKRLIKKSHRGASDGVNCMLTGTEKGQKKIDKPLCRSLSIFDLSLRNRFF